MIFTMCVRVCVCVCTYIITDAIIMTLRDSGPYGIIFMNVFDINFMAMLLKNFGTCGIYDHLCLQLSIFLIPDGLFTSK
jgi:hypothetical protein